MFEFHISATKLFVVITFQDLNANIFNIFNIISYIDNGKILKVFCTYLCANF